LFRSALALGAPAAALAAEYTSLDSQASSITFGYSQMNVKMNGSFGELKATELNFDPARPEEAKVVIEVALASIDAGYDEANTELEKDEWLALAAHPLARFESSKVEDLGNGTYQVTSGLSVKGNTRELTVIFTVKAAGDARVFDGFFAFQRAVLGIGEGQ